MAEIIYGKNGTAKTTAKSVRYTGQFMGVPQLEVEIDGPVPLGFEVGDYIVFSYDGIKYSIMDLPSVTKQASAGSTGDAFVYDSVVFKSPLGLLANVDFLDIVLNENNVHYSTLPVFEFYGTVKDFADRLQANINRLYTGWKVSVEGYDDSTNPNYDTLHEYSNISISNIKCSDSLSIPYETWGITYVFMVDAEGNNCIVFNHALDSTSAKRYGEGNGLYTLTKRMSTEKPVVNRLRAYGSTDNLPARYYNNLDGIDEGIYLPNLMIPRSKWKNQNDPITAYIDSTDIDENDTSMSRYGVREKSIYFDGSNDTEKIEPTIKGVTAGMIRAAKEEMGDTSNVPSATLYPDDERMDKILSCENPDDDGLTREGEKLYSTSVDFNIIKGSDIIQATYSTTANENDTFRRFSVQAEIETNLIIETPAVYRINEKNNSVGNSPIMSIADSKYGSITWEGSVKSGYMDYVKMDVITTDENGNENICAENIQLSWEVNTHVVDGQNRRMLDIFFAGGAVNDVPLYFSITYKGTVKFRIYISGACYFSTGAFAKLRAQMYAVVMTASMGAVIQEKTFKVYIKQIGFNIEDYASTEEAKLVVNSGPCAGRSFNIKKNSCKLYGEYDMTVNPPVYRIAGWSLECFRSLDESISQYFPNNIFTINEEDEFVLTGLEMPDLYVQMASQKLYDEAVKWLWKHKDGLEVFSLDIDNKVAYLDSVKIKEGMLLPLYDENLNVGSKAENEDGETIITYDYRIIDSVTIEIGEESIPVITAVLRKDKEESVFKSLRKTVQDISRRTTQNVIRMQVFNIAEEVVRNNAPAQSPGAGNAINSADFVTLSTEQTVTGKKTFAEDVVFGADGGRMYIPSGSTPGKWAMYVDPSEAVDGEEPQPGGGGGASGLKLNGVLMEGDHDSEYYKINTDTVKISKEIGVQLGGGSLGGYNTGDVVDKGTSMTEFLTKLLSKRTPPSYRTPTITVAGGTSQVEAGTLMTVNLSIVYRSNDAGAATGQTIKRGSSVLYSGALILQSYADNSVRIPDGVTTWSSTVSYQAGPIKNDNLGNPYPEGQIQAGSVTGSWSCRGVRYAFWGCSQSPSQIADSSDVRSLPDKAASSNKITISVPAGSRSVVIAYPKSLGEVSEIMQAATNLDIKGSFVRSEVQVEGASGYSAVPYFVYVYNAAVGFNADTLTVSI